MHYKSPLHATEKYHHQTSSASVTSVPSVVKKTPLRQRYAEVRTRGLPSAARPLPPEHRTYACPFAASHEKKSHDQSRSDSATSVPSVVQKTPLSQPPPPEIAILTADISFRSWYLYRTTAGLARSCTYTSLSHGWVSFKRSIASPSGSAMCPSGNLPGWRPAERQLISNSYRPIAAQQGGA